MSMDPQRACGAKPTKPKGAHLKGPKTVRIPTGRYSGSPH
eukprot:CAMPEP_0179980126 /NCGR_PEP_ID=MMETSP0983-20121128/41762_1 /TAXON_ID=483367 /ORGANISM="non described non described, Strain CCMP 2436" /LENGTH=39 /DNA_ID= /DNA_START= /DNA_END= /DNA_ORIENTATION=